MVSFLYEPELVFGLCVELLDPDWVVDKRADRTLLVLSWLMLVLSWVEEPPPWW
jgi:hypothetical protein